jgi:hypothetical protein
MHNNVYRKGESNKMKTEKTIEHLEKIIEDLKKVKREDAEAYIAEDFKMLLDDVTIVANVNWLGEILSLAIPYNSKLAKKVDEACGKHDYDGINFKYEGYDLWINRENQAWRLRVGPFPERYPKRVEFIKKHVSNIDVSEVERNINSIELDIARDQLRIEEYKNALKEIGK